MEACSIVVHLDVVKHLGFCLLARSGPLAVDGFHLQAVIPVLHGGIVVSVALLAHAANELVVADQRPVVTRAILAAAIRM